MAVFENVVLVDSDDNEVDMTNLDGTVVTKGDAAIWWMNEYYVDYM